MTKRFRVFLLAALMIAETHGASATGFVNNGNTWESLSADSQAAYIQGLNDSANFIFVNDDLATAIVKLARTRCLIEHKTTAASLAATITNVYLVDKSRKNEPPIAIYVYVMGAVCKDIINQERGRLGLPPT